MTNAGTDPVAGTTFASTAGSGGVKDDSLAGGADDYAVTVGELAGKRGRGGPPQSPTVPPAARTAAATVKDAGVEAFVGGR